MFGRFRRSEEVIGFALSGGGSRAASQVGALKALAERDIWPHVIAGTSAGAVNATWLALYPNRIDQLEAIWLRLRTKDIFPGTRVGGLFSLASRGYFHSAAVWERYLRRQIGHATFQDAAIPCSVVAVRLTDGQRVIFDSGEIVPALMASSAIPGVFPPYRIGNDLYVDGGVLEYLPLTPVLDRGATTVFALDCSYFPITTQPTESIMDRCGLVAARASVTQATSLWATRGRKVHVIRPETDDVCDARDFCRSTELMMAGYECAKHYLDEQLPDRRQVAGAHSDETAG
jgi:NTE family protein